MSNMTEGAAKTKWCPMVRSPQFSRINNQAASASTNQVDEANKCIGSDCMMWRTVSEWRNQTELVKGWCGIAGRPEYI